MLDGLYTERPSQNLRTDYVLGLWHGSRGLGSRQPRAQVPAALGVGGELEPGVCAVAHLW